MARNNIIYENLRAEMARKNLAICDISSAIGMNRDRLSRKLSGKSPLFLDEALKIKEEFFPNKELTELFFLSSNDEIN